MASVGKKMAKNSLVYILGKALSIVISILLLPLYTSKIDPSNYGYYDLINTLITYGVAVLVLNISVAVLRFGYEEASDKKTLFSTSTLFTIVMSLIATAGLIIVNSFYPIKYLLIVIALVFVTGFTNLGGSFARCQDKGKLYAYSGLLAGLINAGVGITCVYVFKMQELALFLSLLISHFVQAVFLFFSTKAFKHISFKRISLKALKRMLIFSSPHALSLLCSFLCRDIDKTLISAFLGDDVLGVFSMSLKYMAFITAIVDALALAWSDTTFSISNANDRVSSSILWVNNITKIAAFISTLFIPLIFVSYPFLIKGDYADAFNVIPIIYLSVFFVICSGFYANSFLSEKKPIYLMISRLIAAAVNLTLVFLLMRKIGVFAFAIGYALSAVIEFFLSYLFARVILKMDFSIKPLLFFFPSYGVVCLIYYFGNSYTNIATAVLFAIIIYFVFNSRINYSLKSLVKKFSNEQLLFVDFIENDLNYCKKNKGFLLRLVLLLFLNVAVCFPIYLLSFFANNVLIKIFIIFGVLIVALINYYVGNKLYEKLAFRHKGFYYSIVTIISWLIFSIPISFLNNKLFESTNNFFGSMSFILSLAIFAIYFAAPLLIMRIRKDE